MDEIYATKRITIPVAGGVTLDWFLYYYSLFSDFYEVCLSLV